MKKIYFVLAILCLQLSGHSQIITTVPSFPTVNDTIEIIYDAAQGNGVLAGVTPIYAHTGLITSASNSPTDWKYAPSWLNNNAKYLLTDLGNNKHSMKIHIPSFYGVPSSETVLQMAFVFRNATGSIVGKTASNGDIFVDISQGGFAAGITSPVGEPLFVAQNGSLAVRAEASINASLKLFVNNTLIAQQASAKVLNANVNAATFGVGKHYVIMEAENAGIVIRDSIYYIVREAAKDAPVQAGFPYGINYLSDTSVYLVFHAPLKDFVYVIGDFNDWKVDPDYRMFKDASKDVFHLQINGLTPGMEYAFQYFIDEGGMRVADVYADKLLDPWNDQWINNNTYPNLKPYPTGKTENVVSVLQTAQQPYAWDPNIGYNKPPKDNLIIYELLVRDFVKNRTYNALLDTLDYLEDLGVNAIQLMPIMEFEGNESWGYNPMFFFAPDKYYGTKDDLKNFVEECHKRDIAVILDIALNHSFGLNPQVRMYFNPSAGQFGEPTADNPWFNSVARHDFNVGYDYNHESPHTREFARRVFKYWVEEYKVDGYRLDLSKGFTQNNTLGNIGAWNAYDQSRVDILQDYANNVWSVDPSAYMILEHLGDNSEERELANRGMMPWGIMHANFKECVLGYNNGTVNLNWLNWKSRGYNDPNLIGYAVSHDEERLMVDALQYGNSSGGYNVKNEATALSRIETAHVILMSVPGPKMIWQFDEIGYDISINFNGRTGNKPLVWNYLNEPNRKRLYEVTAGINKLKRDEPAMRTRDFNFDGAGMGKRVHLNHSDMDVTVIANFDVVNISMIPGFQRTGRWYNYFTGDSIQVTDLNASFNLAPGEYQVWTTKRLGEITITPPDTTGQGSFIDESYVENALQAYPNPFTNNLQINLNDFNQLSSLAVYDLQGRMVTQLFTANQGNPSSEVVYWNGADDFGNQVPSGTYIIKATQADKVTTIKVMYLQP